MSTAVKNLHLGADREGYLTIDDPSHIPSLGYATNGVIMTDFLQLLRSTVSEMTITIVIAVRLRPDVETQPPGAAVVRRRLGIET